MKTSGYIFAVSFDVRERERGGMCGVPTPCREGIEGLTETDRKRQREREKQRREILQEKRRRAKGKQRREILQKRKK